MKNKISDLNNHLFETIEKIKNNSDPEASPNEKIDLETSQRIAEIGKVIIEGAKVQVQALGIISKCQNPVIVSKAMENVGIIEIDDQNKMLIQ